MTAGASHDEASSLSQYLRVLRRRWWIVLVCALLVPVAALFFSLRRPAQYAASAEVLLSRQNLGDLLSGTPDLTLVNNTSLMATQAELAHTPDVARAALAIAKTSDLTPGGLGRTDLRLRQREDRHPCVQRHRPRSRPGGSPRDVLGPGVCRLSQGARYEVARQGAEDVAATLDQLRAQGKRERSALYSSLEEKEQQLQTLLTLQTSQATLTRPPTPIKVAPTPTRNAILGLALGLVLG